MRVAYFDIPLEISKCSPSCLNNLLVNSPYNYGSASYTKLYKAQSTPVSSKYDISEISVYIAATLPTSKNGHNFHPTGVQTGSVSPTATAPSEDK